MLKRGKIRVWHFSFKKMIGYIYTIKNIKLYIYIYIELIVYKIRVEVNHKLFILRIKVPMLQESFHKYTHIFSRTYTLLTLKQLYLSRLQFYSKNSYFTPNNKHTWSRIIERILADKSAISDERCNLKK